MPTFQAFHATIRVEGKDLPEYDVQVDDDEKQVSCWIPSEAGKNFSVCWSATESPTDLGGYLMLDGISGGGFVCPKGSKIERVITHQIQQPVISVSLRYLLQVYDDVYLNTPVSNLGEIKLDIWACNIIKENESPKRLDPIASSHVKVHERSKKIGTHRIQFGDLKEVPPATFSSVSKIEKLVTFVFRYRPLELLQATGIAPLPSPVVHPRPNNKRKSLGGDETEDMKSTDEEENEINRRVKELKDELEKLESRRAKRIKVKVEKREHSPRLNGEVIDLT